MRYHSNSWISSVVGLCLMAIASLLVRFFPVFSVPIVWIEEVLTISSTTVISSWIVIISMIIALLVSLVFNRWAEALYRRVKGRVNSADKHGFIDLAKDIAIALAFVSVLFVTFLGAAKLLLTFQQAVR